MQIAGVLQNLLDESVPLQTQLLLRMVLVSQGDRTIVKIKESNELIQEPLAADIGELHSAAQYPEVIIFNLYGKLQFPQANESGRRARNVGDTADNPSNLPTQELLLVKHGLGRIKITNASSGWISFLLHLGTVIKKKIIPPRG